VVPDQGHGPEGLPRRRQELGFLLGLQVAEGPRDSFTGFTFTAGFSPSNFPHSRQRLNSALRTASSRLETTRAPASRRARRYFSIRNGWISPRRFPANSWARLSRSRQSR